MFKHASIYKITPDWFTGLAKRSQVMQQSRLRTLVFMAQGVTINYNTGRI